MLPHPEREAVALASAAVAPATDEGRASGWRASGFGTGWSKQECSPGPTVLGGGQ
jgi:hypothetical protein